MHRIPKFLAFVLLVAAAVLTPRIAKAEASNGRTLIVIVAPGGGGDARIFGEMAQRYREHFQGSSSVEVEFQNYPLGNVRDEAFERVLYVVTGDGGIGYTEDGRPGFDIAGLGTQAINSRDAQFLRQIQRHSPNARRRDLALLTCRAGLFDPSWFDGDVFGVSPGDGVLRTSDVFAFVRSLGSGDLAFPQSAREFYKTWRRFVSTRVAGWGPSWFSPYRRSLLRPWTRPTYGTRQMGLSGCLSAECRAHRHFFESHGGDLASVSNIPATLRAGVRGFCARVLTFFQ